MACAQPQPKPLKIHSFHWSEWFELTKSEYRVCPSARPKVEASGHNGHLLTANVPHTHTYLEPGVEAVTCRDLGHLEEVAPITGVNSTVGWPVGRLMGRSARAVYLGYLTAETLKDEERVKEGVAAEMTWLVQAGHGKRGP
ncbi:hypothetical protein NDU88_001414 [Pleurodeles waltl]|uniref:Uncharacterized protein n=1 Tax=Pleurodeles waltl TaxID=8319 RepID=A0AAV7P431_PLEWA|nr:hypothetical protein NDU88_001414 [Pleurodeles waltl]